MNPPVELTDPCTLGELRLVNGSSEMEGAVEVCFGNIWGSICSNAWDNRDAGVVCKQLFNSSYGKPIYNLHVCFVLSVCMYKHTI